jgi:hypothetical protein
MKSIEVAWANRKTVILVVTVQQGTWADYDRSLYEVGKLLATVDHTVDFISDWTGHPQPPNSSALAHFKKVAQNPPPNAGQIVCVGYPFFLRLLLEVSHRVFPWRPGLPYVVNTLDEAWALIGVFQAERRAKESQAQPDSERVLAK